MGGFVGGWALWVAVTERGRLIVNQYLKRPLPKSLSGNPKSERAMLMSSWQHQLAESVGLVASCQGEQGNEREREKERGLQFCCRSLESCCRSNQRREKDSGKVPCRGFHSLTSEINLECL